MDKNEFLKMLEKHDWYYRRSDNSKIHRAGAMSEDKIIAVKKDNPELQKVYDDFLEKK